MTGSVSLNVTTNTSDTVRNNRIILKNDGSNFLAWRIIMPVYLQAQPYAWEVVNGDLDPLKAAEKTNYDIGNKNGREVILGTLQQATLIRLFSRDSAIITAKDAYDRLIRNYQPNSPIFADIAIEKFMSFTYNKSISVRDNLTIFTKLVNDLDETDCEMSAKCITARLVNALPSSWETFKSSWGTKDAEQKSYNNLVEMITAEDARRNMNNSLQQEATTALAARVGGRRPTHGRRHQQSTSTMRSSSTFQRNTSTITCWNCNKQGHKAASCRSRPNNRPRQPTAQIAEVLTTSTHPPQEEGSEVGGVRFLIDSGASCHIVNDRRYFTKYVSLEHSRDVTLGDSSTVQAHGSGTVEFTVLSGGRKVKVQLERVLHVPKMTYCLISLGALLSSGYRCTVRCEGILFLRKNDRIYAGRNGALFELKGSVTMPAMVQAAMDIADESPVSLKEAHRALGHVHKEKVREVLKRTGIPFIDDYSDCTSCIRGKQTKASYRTRPSSARASSIGIIHGDLCSPTPPSIHGHNHFLVLTDEYSKFRRVFFLKQKDDTINCIRDYIKWFKNQTGRNIIRLHTDRGLEFLNAEIAAMLKDIGAEQSTSNARTPQQNGISERSNRSLLDLARTILIDSKLSKRLWSEAINFANQILNSITFNKQEDKSSFEIIYGRKPYLGKVHPFGTECFYLDQDPGRKKMQDRGIEAFLTGLNDGVLGYRVLLRGTNSIKVSNNIRFLRQSPLRHSSVQDPSDGGATSNGPNSASHNASSNEEDSLTDRNNSAPNPEEEAAEEGDDEENPRTPEDQPSTEQQQPPADPPQRSPDIGQRDTEQSDRSTQQQQVPNETQRATSPEPRSSQRQSDASGATQRRESGGRQFIDDDQQPSTSRQAGGEMNEQNVRSDRPRRPRVDPKVYVEDPIKIPSKRKRKQKKPAQVNTVTVDSNDRDLPEEPQTFEQAISSPHKDDWLSSMKEELTSMDSLNVWTLMSLPPGRRSLPCRWVFKTKRSAEGEIERFRSRLVLKGFLQKEGVDYNELYSPTAKFEAIRVILNIVAKERLAAYQFDVKTAFLYADLDQEIFMSQPPGFEDGTGRVCKLNKSIYGLRQSNRMCCVPELNSPPCQ